MNKLMFAFFILHFIIKQINCQCEGLRDGYYADTIQCDKYYRCYNETVYSENLCPDGLVFNEFGNINFIRCELPFHVDCSSRPELQSAQTSKNCPRKYGMWPDPTDCSKFIHCSDGMAFPTSCAPGLAYNSEKGICDWPENTGTCSEENTLGFTCPSVDNILIDSNQDTNYAKHIREFNLHIQSRHPHPTDCAKLYVCVYGHLKRIPRLLSCEYGKVYNSESGECDDPEYVPGCENYYDRTEEAEGHLVGENNNLS